MGMRTDKYMRQKRRLFQRSKTMPICHSTNQTLSYTYTCCCVFFSLYTQSQGRVRKSISNFISHDAESREQISGTKLRSMIQEGKAPSEFILRPEVAKVIIDFDQPFVDQIFICTNIVLNYEIYFIFTGSSNLHDISSFCPRAQDRRFY